MSCIPLRVRNKIVRNKKCDRWRKRKCKTCRKTEMKLHPWLRSCDDEYKMLWCIYIVLVFVSWRQNRTQGKIKGRRTGEQNERGESSSLHTVLRFCRWFCCWVFRVYLLCSFYFICTTWLPNFFSLLEASLRHTQTVLSFECRTVVLFLLFIILAIIFLRFCVVLSFIKVKSIRVKARIIFFVSSSKPSSKKKRLFQWKGRKSVTAKEGSRSSFRRKDYSSCFIDPLFLSWRAEWNLM